MSSLVKRLRNFYQHAGSVAGHLPLEATDEIERQSNNTAILAQQVADLTAEREHLRAEVRSLRNFGVVSAERMEALTAERDALRDDAERWRELKRLFTLTKSSQAERIVSDLGLDLKHIDDIESAIDAVREQPISIYAQELTEGQTDVDGILIVPPKDTTRSNS